MSVSSDQYPDKLVALLDLKPHPEGGFYGETYRHPAVDGERSICTAIYYLLRSGERSRWHRVDATEIWHWYAGGPLGLSLWEDSKPKRDHRLGADFAVGERPQLIIPPNVWQTAEPLGPWTLVGCTVSPGFEFSGFEMAADDWEPKSDG